MQIWIDAIFNGMGLYLAIGLVVLMAVLIREGKFVALVIAEFSDMSLWIAYAAISIITLGAWWIVLLYEVIGPKTGGDKNKK